MKEALIAVIVLVPLVGLCAQQFNGYPWNNQTGYYYYADLEQAYHPISQMWERVALLSLCHYGTTAAYDKRYDPAWEETFKAYLPPTTNVVVSTNGITYTNITENTTNYTVHLHLRYPITRASPTWTDPASETNRYLGPYNATSIYAALGPYMIHRLQSVLFGSSLPLENDPTISEQFCMTNLCDSPGVYSGYFADNPLDFPRLYMPLAYQRAGAGYVYGNTTNASGHWDSTYPGDEQSSYEYRLRNDTTNACAASLAYTTTNRTRHVLYRAVYTGAWAKLYEGVSLSAGGINGDISTKPALIYRVTGTNALPVVSVTVAGTAYLTTNIVQVEDDAPGYDWLWWVPHMEQPSVATTEVVVVGTPTNSCTVSWNTVTGMAFSVAGNTGDTCAIVYTNPYSLYRSLQYQGAGGAPDVADAGQMYVLDDTAKVIQQYRDWIAPADRISWTGTQLVWYGSSTSSWQEAKDACEASTATGSATTAGPLVGTAGRYWNIGAGGTDVLWQAWSVARDCQMTVATSNALTAKWSWYLWATNLNWQPYGAGGPPPFDIDDFASGGETVTNVSFRLLSTDAASKALNTVTSDAAFGQTAGPWTTVGWCDEPDTNNEDVAKGWSTRYATGVGALEF